MSKTINVRSAVEEVGHFRAGRLIPTEGIELTLDEGNDLPQAARVAAGIVNAEDLKSLRRDKRVAVDGYPHIPRAEADAEDAAAAKARETEAAQVELARKQVLAQAGAINDVAASAAAAARQAPKPKA